MCQLQHQRFNDGTVADRVPHLPHQLTHGRAGLSGEFLVRDVLPLIERVQLVLKNAVGQSRAHCLDPVGREKALHGIVGPDRHVDMRVFALIVVCGAPPKLFRRDLHGVGQLHLMRFDELLPACGAVVTEARRILPVQRVDERPDDTSVL